MREWRETILEMLYQMSPLIHCLIKKDVEGGKGDVWVGVILAERADLAVTLVVHSFYTKRS